MSGLLKRRLFTACIAAAGVGLFLWFRLPIPFLLGPMFLCLIFSLGGAQLEGMGWLGSAFRTVLGVAAGASITPDVMQAVPEMALSLAVLPVFVICTALVSYPLMRRGFGFDPGDGCLCSGRSRSRRNPQPGRDYFIGQFCRRDRDSGQLVGQKTRN